MEEYARIYYIVFDKIEKNKWWSLFLNKEFMHCYMVTDAGDKSIAINTKEGGTTIYTMDECVETVVRKLRDKKLRIIRYMVHGRNLEMARVRIFCSCVGIIKDLLGVNSLLVQTPKQLFKYLSRR